MLKTLLTIYGTYFRVIYTVILVYPRWGVIVFETIYPWLNLTWYFWMAKECKYVSMQQPALLVTKCYLNGL